MGSSFAPLPPYFHQLALGAVEVSFGKKSQSGTPVRNVPKKHSPTLVLGQECPRPVPHFKGALQKVKPDPPCVSLLQKWNSQTHSFICIMKHYDSPGPVPGTRPPGGTSHSLCLKDLLAKVRKGTKHAHVRPEGKMKHRM